MGTERGRICAARAAARGVGRLAASAASCVAILAVCVAPALAQSLSPSLFGGLAPGETVTLSLMIGVVTFAVISAISLIRSRNATEIENRRLRLETAGLRAAADRAEALVGIGDDRLVAWEAAGVPPEVVGKLPSIPGVPDDRQSFLAFGRWLSPDSAASLDRAVARLRERGEAFQLAIVTHGGRWLETVGRTAGGRAVVRFRDLTGDKLARVTLEARHHEVSGALDALHVAAESAGLPMWMRDSEGRLTWVSRAYAEAVEAGGAEALEREFLDSATREATDAAHAAGAVFGRRLSVVVGGARRVYDVTDAGLGGGGSVGLAIDVTALDEAESALRRIVDFHGRTLDQLAAGVAIFGSDRRLQSYNAAYRALFDLDVPFLDAMPEEGEILDRLRAARKLPEQADYRSWRNELLSAYRSLDAREHLWYLPDGQKLRVVANPHPHGGLTWIYENVTERLDLESRYNALARVQGETLDHLAEAVAVFGSDGRLRLNNPAFMAIWRLDAERLGDRPHVADLVRQARRLHDAPGDWERLVACVAGVDESRSTVAGRMERVDGRAIDYATVPLPEGQTMLTFVDVSDTVQVERALKDRNDALEAADGLKNAFIHHVSYELRSPLTNIIGFTQLLAEESFGTLNPKQREYTGYIMASSSALHAIVNDILDLATVDAGIVDLDLTEIDLERAIEASIEGVRDRLAEGGIRLETRIEGGLGLIADEKRLRQILYNLLSNAVRFSFPGGLVSLVALSRGDHIEFRVEDEGAGMPADFVPTAFDRFVSRSGGTARGGAGLGLSIVKSFVELHGGEVEIASREGGGTTVSFRLPVAPQAAIVAAE